MLLPLQERPKLPHSIHTIAISLLLCTLPHHRGRCVTSLFPHCLIQDGSLPSLAASGKDCPHLLKQKLTLCVKDFFFFYFHFKPNSLSSAHSPNTEWLTSDSIPISPILHTRTRTPDNSLETTDWEFCNSLSNTNDLELEAALFCQGLSLTGLIPFSDAAVIWLLTSP